MKRSPEWFEKVLAPDDVRYRHCTFCAGHPDLGGLARVGHMWIARATGMKVRRYFVGFGPTLWSTRRGETEYGVKAVPLGGFCDIAGMTPVEDLAPDEGDRAMYKQQTWKRVAVLFAGPAMNIVICMVLIYVIALIWGCPTCTRRPRRSWAKLPALHRKYRLARSAPAPAPVRQRRLAFALATSWSSR